MKRGKNSKERLIEDEIKEGGQIRNGKTLLEGKLKGMKYHENKARKRRTAKKRNGQKFSEEHGEKTKETGIRDENFSSEE